jgi:putative nucleotidyltransferase with HDIG domain
MKSILKYAGKDYFEVPVDLLVAGRAIDFPLSIHLVLNKSMVLRYDEDAAPLQHQLRTYLKRGLKFFYCPDEFYPRWLAYLKAVADETRVENLAVAEKAFSDTTITTDQKKEMLAEVGRKMVGVMNDFASDDPEKKKAAYEECKSMTDDIIGIALQSHKLKSVYEDLLMMRAAGIEHSSSVSTIAVVFALTIGFVDESGLADIALGALLHDVGHSQVPLDIFEKPYLELGKEDKKAFSGHPSGGVELLKDIGEVVPSIVQRIVEDHHEKFGGSGFSKGLSGFQIDERVQIVGLADTVDDLMLGRMTGEPLDPVEAFQWIKNQQGQNAGALFASPDIFESIFQVVMNSKPTDLSKIA